MLRRTLFIDCINRIMNRLILKIVTPTSELLERIADVIALFADLIQDLFVAEWHVQKVLPTESQMKRQIHIGTIVDETEWAEL